MKYFFITGEESGSNYAASVISQLKLIDTQATFYGLGNELMKKEGCELIIPIEKMAFMGFADVLKNIFTIRKNFKQTKKSILTIKPDVVCLIDYAGFNLKMARWCKQNGFKVVYYILPKVWAWNEKRIHILKQYCDELISIFEFEKKYFDAKNIKVHYYGNPLTEKNNQLSYNENAKKIALLPGSRKQEIKYLMPIFVDFAKENTAKEFVVAGIDKLKEYYPNTIPNNIKIIYNNLDEVLNQSKYAIVCSGTATLEVALRGIPQIVVYKTNKLNYYIGKKLINVKYISLPNLIANDEIIRELIQDNCTSKNIEIELSKLDMKKNIYEKIGIKLSENKAVSSSVAKLLFNTALQ